MIRFVWRGFSVEVTFLFAATVTFCLLTDESGVSVLALSACFFHETGHLIAFRLTGYRPRALIFELCGIRLVPPGKKPAFWENLFVQSGGVLMNFICGSVFFLLNKPTGAAVHLLLAAFSLLPLSTLDGGQLLSAVLSEWMPVRGAWICLAADLLTTAVLCALCLFTLFSGGRSLTMLVFSGGLCASLFTEVLRVLRDRRKNRRNSRIPR